MTNPIKMRDYKKDFVALLKEMMHDNNTGLIGPMIAEGLREANRPGLQMAVRDRIERNLFSGHGGIKKFETTSGGRIWIYLDDMKVEDIESYDKNGQLEAAFTFGKTCM